MDEVFTLTQGTNSPNREEKFVYSSSSIYGIVDFLIKGDESANKYHIYVTDYSHNSIPYEDWERSSNHEFKRT